MASSPETLRRGSPALFGREDIFRERGGQGDTWAAWVRETVYVCMVCVKFFWLEALESVPHSEPLNIEL